MAETENLTNGHPVPSCLPVPSSDYSTHLIKVGSVPASAGNLTLSILGAPAGASIEAGSVVRGRIIKNADTHQVLLDLRVEPELLVACPDGITLVAVEEGTGAELLRATYSVTPDGSPEAVAALNSEAYRQLAEIRATALVNSKLDAEAAAAAATDDAPAGAEPRREPTDDPAPTTDAPATVAEPATTAEPELQPTASSTAAAPAPTVPGSHSEPQVTVSATGNGTTVRVDVATGVGSRVQVGTITVEPVSGAGGATSSGSAATNGQTPAAAGTSADAQATWRIEPAELPLDGLEHTVTITGERIPPHCTVTFDSTLIRAVGTPRRLATKLYQTVATERATFKQVQDGTSAAAEVNVPGQAEPVRLPDCIQLQPMEDWRGGTMDLALWAVALLLAYGVIATLVAGTGQLPSLPLAPHLFCAITAAFGLAYVNGLRHGKRALSPLGAFTAVLAVLTAVIFTVTNGGA